VPPAVQFLVVGVARSQASGEDADEQNRLVQLPLTTFQRSFQRGNKIGWYAITLLPDRSPAQVEKEVRALLMRRHHVAPEDEHALGSFDGSLCGERRLPRPLNAGPHDDERSGAPSPRTEAVRPGPPCAEGVRPRTLHVSPARYALIRSRALVIFRHRIGRFANSRQ